MIAKNLNAAFAAQMQKEQVSTDQAGTRTELANYIISIFETFKTARLPWELVLQECWYNYMGMYQADTRWKKTEATGGRSKIFIKLTTLKCHTAHAKFIDIYAGKGVPFDLEPINPEQYGIDIETAKELTQQYKKRLARLFKLVNLEAVLDSATLELCILGTAVIKGPIIEYRRTPIVKRRQIGGLFVDELNSDMSPFELSTQEEAVPIFEHIPLWEYYVDLNAKSPKESIGEIHFQRMLPAKFLHLAYQGGYFADRVLEASQRATLSDQNDKKYIQLGDNYTGDQGVKDEKISVLEYQGLVPVRLLKSVGAEIPQGYGDNDYIESIVVLAADGIVIKAVVNPLGKRQFKVCSFKKRPGIILGQGVAEAMRDSQKMINSAARLLIDNKALSSVGLVGINMDRIDTKRTKNLDIYTTKTIYVKGNYTPKEAMDSITFSDVSMGLQQLIELFERFSDEETGIPKYTQGLQDSYLNKTATGMSMLMSQSQLGFKPALKNIDDYWIEPIVEDYMYLDMQFFAKESGIRIPFKVKATGLDSLMAKEIKLENSMKFLQVTQNPQDAMFLDRVKMMKDISRLLDVEDYVRSDEEIKNIMQELTQQAMTDSNWKDMVSIDKLFPLLSPAEQTQILQKLGIQPDPQGRPVIPQPATSPQQVVQ